MSYYRLIHKKKNNNNARIRDPCQSPHILKRSTKQRSLTINVCLSEIISLPVARLCVRVCVCVYSLVQPRTASVRLIVSSRPAAVARRTRGWGPGALSAVDEEGGEGPCLRAVNLPIPTRRCRDKAPLAARSVVRPRVPNRGDDVRGRRVVRASLLHVVHQTAVLVLHVEARLLTAGHAATVARVHLLQVVQGLA